MQVEDTGGLRKASSNLSYISPSRGAMCNAANPHFTHLFELVDWLSSELKISSEVWSLFLASFYGFRWAMNTPQAISPEAT